jgi:hypothetical protein
MVDSDDRNYSYLTHRHTHFCSVLVQLQSLRKANHMNQIEITNLNPAGADLFQATDSFLTELQDTDTTDSIYGGKKSGRGGGTFFYSGGGYGGYRGGYGGYRGGYSGGYRGGYGGYRGGYGYGGGYGGGQILFYGGGGGKS